jgi:hypothetical protein
MHKHKIYIGSVKKELSDERRAIKNFVAAMFSFPNTLTYFFLKTKFELAIVAISWRLTKTFLSDTMDRFLCSPFTYRKTCGSLLVGEL